MSITVEGSGECESVIGIGYRNKAFSATPVVVPVLSSGGLDILG